MNHSPNAMSPKERNEMRCPLIDLWQRREVSGTRESKDKQLSNFCCHAFFALSANTPALHIA